MILFCSGLLIFKCTWWKIKQSKIIYIKIEASFFTPLIFLPKIYHYTSFFYILPEIFHANTRKKNNLFHSHKMVAALYTAQHFANSCLVFHWINVCVILHLTHWFSSLAGHYSYVERFKCPDHSLRDPDLIGLAWGLPICLYETLPR